MINIFKKPIPKNAVIRFLPLPEADPYFYPVIEKEEIKAMQKRWEELKGKCPLCKMEKAK